MSVWGAPRALVSTQLLANSVVWLSRASQARERERVWGAPTPRSRASLFSLIQDCYGACSMALIHGSPWLDLHAFYSLKGTREHLPRSSQASACIQKHVGFFSRLAQ